jgi:hypothetical protein
MVDAPGVPRIVKSRISCIMVGCTACDTAEIVGVRDVTGGGTGE